MPCHRKFDYAKAGHEVEMTMRHLSSLVSLLCFSLVVPPVLLVVHANSVTADPSVPAGTLPQPATVAHPGTETMTNATITELLGMGFGDQVILEKMASSRCQFDLTMEGLRKLKAARASDPVIAAMMKTSTQQSVADAAGHVDLDDPATPHPAGIWLSETTAGVPHMVQLEPTGFSQEKSGGVFASMMSYGLAKTKEKATLRGAHAGLRVHESLPSFYFYFEVKNAGLSNSGFGGGGNLTNPNEFALVQMTVKGSGRELIVGQANAYKSESGTMTKDVREFVQEKIADGAYRVRPLSPLGPGEYGFYAATSMGGGVGAKVFDFSVDTGSARERSAAVDGADAETVEHQRTPGKRSRH